MSIGLAFSGGGVKGAAHIGVLKAFEEENINISFIGGTSSGSIVATLYAVGYSSDEIYYIFKKYCKKIKYIDIKNIIKLFFGFICTGKIIVEGLNSGEIIYKLINKMCKEKNVINICDINFPLVIPSVNMETGEVVCFTSSKLRSFSDRTVFINNANIGTVVQASCSFPAIFSPCNFKKIKLIDGGIRENVPWREVKLLGADKVVSIIFENKVDKLCCKNLVDVTYRSYELLCKELTKYELDGSDFCIKIKSEKISLLDNSKIDYFYSLGYKKAKEFIKINKIN